MHPGKEKNGAARSYTTGMEVGSNPEPESSRYIWSIKLTNPKRFTGTQLVRDGSDAKQLPGAEQLPNNLSPVFQTGRPQHTSPWAISPKNKPVKTSATYHKDIEMY